MMRRFWRGKILRLQPSNVKTRLGVSNCWCVNLGAEHRVQVPRVVCRAFNGEPPTDEHEMAHRDGDGANNRPGNLFWATRAEITQLCITHGVHPHGSRSGNNKATEEQVPIIIERYASMLELAAEYGVSRGTIGRMTAGTGWTHVASPMREAVARRTKGSRTRARGSAAGWPAPPHGGSGNHHSMMSAYQATDMPGNANFICSIAPSRVSLLSRTWCCRSSSSSSGRQLTRLPSAVVVVILI
jgi:hypothetical protein